MVDAKIVEAMTTLWVILFCKEAEFFEVIFEGNAAHVAAEILSSPPYLSKNGHMNESIVRELHGFRYAKFVHVRREM